jgi:hypothetical protein
MDWKYYEKITKYIYETLGKEAGVKIDGHGSTCKVRGKSGVDHQIDVLTIHSDGVHTYRTAIECKYWEDNINKDIVMKVAEIIEDAGINKGVIVSKRGFTQDGITFAKYKNIGLVELREIEEKDWKGRGRIFDIKTFIRRAEILSITIGNVGPNLKPERIEPKQLKVKLASGDEISFDNYLTSFKKELQKEEPNKVIQKSYELKGAKLVNEKIKRVTPIIGIKLSGRLTEMDSGLKWHAVDEIWLIMKSIFENKSFTISKTGVIKEDKHGKGQV